MIGFNAFAAVKVNFSEIVFQTVAEVILLPYVHVFLTAVNLRQSVIYGRLAYIEAFRYKLVPNLIIRELLLVICA